MKESPKGGEGSTVFAAGSGSMNEYGYLAIEYDCRLPLLKYTNVGWAIERDIYAGELPDRLDREIEHNTDTSDISWLSERNPQVLELVAERITRSGDSRYFPFLMQWNKKASRRKSYNRRQAILSLR